jgi:two-component sensor histidine kinase
VAQLNSFRVRIVGEFQQVQTLTIWSLAPNGTALGNLNIILTERRGQSEEFSNNISAQNTSPPTLDSSQLIIGELQHRLRNILMVVSSLAENTARTSDSLNDFLSSFSGKLKALIRSHEQVCSDRQSAMLFRELASNEIGRILSEPSLVSIKSPVIYIRKELIPIFQLILYELTTNSLKYGAAKSLRGSITLSCSHSVNSHMDPVVEFHWREHWKATNGINGTSDCKHASGLNSGGNGMRLLKTLITKYFKGTFNYALEAQTLDVRWDLSQQTLAPGIW